MPASTGQTRTADVERESDARINAAYQQGHSEGVAAAGQRLEPALAALRNMVISLAGAQKQFRAEAEAGTVKLAIAVARRVLHRELATDPEAILGLVIAAFQKLNARETHRLRVSPADLSILELNRERLNFPGNIEIVAESSLTSGSAIFETSRGVVDASVDTQFSEIERGLADVLRRRIA
jgi:flagellar assembly protein FliH